MSSCCYTGHYFASNVGVLPVEGCLISQRHIFSRPKKKFSRRFRKRFWEMRKELLSCVPNPTLCYVPTIDSRFVGLP